MSTKRTESDRQARASLAFKAIVWVTLAILGFMLTWFRPALSDLMLWVLVGLAVLCTFASTGLDVARGANVVLLTALLLVVGAVILGMFFWIYLSNLIPVPIDYDVRPPTPIP